MVYSKYFSTARSQFLNTFYMQYDLSPAKALYENCTWVTLNEMFLQPIQEDVCALSRDVLWIVRVHYCICYGPVKSKSIVNWCKIIIYV